MNIFYKISEHILIKLRKNKYLTYVHLLSMFTINEQQENVNIMDKFIVNTEEDILQGAIEAFRKTIPMRINVELVQQQPVYATRPQPDRLLKMVTAGVEHYYCAEIKRAVTKANKLLLLIGKENLQHPLLLITKHVNIEMADRLAKDGIEFIDTAGNAFINRPPLYVFIKGNRLTETTKRVQLGRVFRPTGLKMLYTILCNPGLEKRTIREIAVAANVAIGTVDWILKELKELGFLIDMGKQGYMLVKKEYLLQRWVAAYPEQLRPKQALGRFKGTYGWWQNANIDPLRAQWGGEVAAAKLTHYIQPQIVTIYTTFDYINQVLIENKLKKDIKGDTEILARFWNQNVTWEHNDLAHPILIYADLLATGDPRNIETAKMIYEEHVVRYIREN